MDANLLSGADLAFLGDAYYELEIRDYVMHKGITSLFKLHNECVRFVSRSAQAKIVSLLMPELTEEEVLIFKRGRNYDYKTKTAEYVNASGFEAVIGYLYLTNAKERLNEIINRAIEIIEGKDE